MQSPKKKWKRLIKFLGPLLYIFLLLKIVDPRLVADLLKGIRIEIVLLSLPLIPIIISIRTYRWWVICKLLKMETSFSGLFQIYYISWFLGALPLSGIAILSKIMYLKEDGKPAGIVATSITIDKLFDILGHLLFALFGILYFPKDLLGNNHQWVLYFGILMVIVSTVLFFGGRIWEALRRLIKQYLVKGGEKLENAPAVDLAELWPSLSVKAVSLILGLSIFLGLVRSLVLYLLAISVGMYVTFWLMVACRALIGMVNIIPVTINGLGTRDAILLLTLPLSGISKESALALGALAFLWALGSKLSGMIFWLKRPLPS